MTPQQIYNLSIELGITHDLRGQAKVKKMLARVKEKYEKLNNDQKQEFDKEKLTNPYSDTRILFEGSKKPIKKILAGIDIGPDEILLADRLGDIDLVIAHHPMGKALADLSEVMHLQAEVLYQYGVPINVAESLLKERISEVSRALSPGNHNRAVDAARILNVNVMCVHTPCDNLAADFLDKQIKKHNPEYVDEVMKILKKIPEYQEAIKLNSGPRLFAGSEENRTGKIALTEITGGTEGSPKIYEKMSQAGIGTIIGMHMSEEHKKQAEQAHMNAVVAGHISSDSIGMNLLLDQLEKRGVKIVPCSGLIRVRRK